MSKKISQRRIIEFRNEIWRFYRAHGRDLPWRKTRNPYRIMVSEFMLQQTQVERVIPKYTAFLKKFPSIATLARAPLSRVLGEWQGLGYNRRCLYLKSAAVRIVEEYGGEVPTTLNVLCELPGIGRGTAGAISAFAFNQPVVFIETNIRRVFLHSFFKRQEQVPDVAVMEVVAQTIDAKNPREWYYALIDYGAMLGRLRRAKENPNRRSRHYTMQSKFEGSDRQIRGRFLRLMLADGSFGAKDIIAKLSEDKERVIKILKGLANEGFLEYHHGRYYLTTKK